MPDKTNLEAHLIEMHTCVYTRFARARLVWQTWLHRRHLNRREWHGMRVKLGVFPGPTDDVDSVQGRRWARTLDDVWKLAAIRDSHRIKNMFGSARVVKRRGNVYLRERYGNPHQKELWLVQPKWR